MTESSGRNASGVNLWNYITMSIATSNAHSVVKRFIHCVTFKGKGTLLIVAPTTWKSQWISRNVGTDCCRHYKTTWIRIWIFSSGGFCLPGGWSSATPRHWWCATCDTAILCSKFVGMPSQVQISNTCSMQSSQQAWSSKLEIQTSFVSSNSVVPNFFLRCCRTSLCGEPRPCRGETTHWGSREPKIVYRYRCETWNLDALTCFDMLWPRPSRWWRKFSASWWCGKRMKT